MELETYFKNPSGQSSKKSARHTPVPDTPPTGMDPAKQITGLVKTGGAVVGGQVAATLITTQALSMGGELTRSGTLGHKLGSVAIPVVVGGLVMGLSKNKSVQMAGVGAVSAGVAAATNMILKEKTPGFYPGDGGYAVFSTEPDAEEAEQLAGYEPLQLAPAAYQRQETYQLVDADQLV